VGALPVDDSEEVKRTNEIKMAIPLLDAIDIEGKDVSADALLTQRKLADYLVTERKAPPDHGRIETRKIWTTSELNDYLDFPHVGQAFVVERHAREKKSGASSLEIAYGITSKTPDQADPQRVLKINRQHWTIENSCHYILDWNYDEDRSRIRTGHGPENITRLRRFAIGVIRSKGARVSPRKCDSSGATCDWS